MTLDEAIKHCVEVAAECDKYEVEIEYKCGQEHRQLAEWLKELKERRAADVQPEKCGRWIAVANGKMKNWKQKCSVCGVYRRGKTNYCPDCGARMNGGASNA